MALEPKSVKLGGQELKDIRSVTFEVATPTDGVGRHQGLTRAMVITLSRLAAVAPSIAGFKQATNGDGRYTETKLEIVLQNATTAEAMRLTCDKAFVSRYKLENPQGDHNPATEEIEVHAGEVTINAGGNNTKFKLSDFSAVGQ